MSKASMGVRTIALRMAGTEEAKQQLEDLGEDTSDFIVQTRSKVDAQVRKYTATASNPNGVSVLDSNGRLRDTYDVLVDIADVWDEIVAKDDQAGTNTSNALLELLAGKTRSNVLASMLQNPDILRNAYETSKNSAGIGQRELDIYLDSVLAKTTQLQNKFEELAVITINSEGLKTVLDIINSIMSAVNGLAKAIGGLNVGFGAIAGLMMQKTGRGFVNYSKKNGLELFNIFSGKNKANEGSSPVIQLTQKEIEQGYMDPEKAIMRGISAYKKAQQQTPQEQQSAQEQSTTTQTKVNTEATEENAEQMKEAADNISEKAEEKGYTATVTPSVSDDTSEATSDAKKVGQEIGQEIQEGVQEGAEQTAEQQSSKIVNFPGVTPEQTPEQSTQQSSGMEDMKQGANEAADAFNKAGNAAGQMGQKITLLGNISKSLTNIFGQLGSTIVNMGVAMAASWAISQGIKLFNYLKNYQDNIIKKGKQATDDISERANNISNLQNNILGIGKSISKSPDDVTTTEQSIDKIANRYTELSRQVNSVTNQNISLTNEEYKEYLDLCNKLAEQFPILSSATDDQGNALLTLGDNASIAAEELMSLYEASLLVSNLEISEKMGDAYKGFVERQRKKAVENNQLQREIDSAEAMYNAQMGEDYILINQKAKKSELIKMMKEAGYGSTNGTIMSQDDILEDGTIRLRFKADFSDEETRNNIQSVVDAFNVSQSSIYSPQAETDRSKMKVNDAEIDQVAQEVKSTIQANLNTRSDFVKLNDEIKNSILTDVGNLTTQDIEAIESYTGGFDSFVNDKYISKIQKLSSDKVQKGLESTFAIDPLKQTVSEYYNAVKQSLLDATDNDGDLAAELFDLLGFDSIHEEWAKKKDSIIDAFGGQEGLNPEDILKITGLTGDEINNAIDLLGQKTYKSTEFGKFWADLEKESQRQPQKLDTFSELMNDETYQKDAEAHEKKLTTLSSALQTLREDGSLTADVIADLWETFPDMEDISEKSLNEQAFKELDAQIDRVKESMKGMAPDEIARAQSYIRNLIEQWGELGATQANVHDAYMDNVKEELKQSGASSGVANMRIEQEESNFAEGISAIQEAYGEDINWNIVYSLIMNDQFSGDAEEIKAAYDNETLTWNLDLKIENAKQRLNKILEGNNRKKGIEDTQNDLILANGGFLTPDNYKVAVSTRKINLDAAKNAYEDAQTELANFEKGREERIDRYGREKYNSDWDKLDAHAEEMYQQYLDAQADYDEVVKEQIESEIGMTQWRLDHAKTRTENLQAQNEKYKQEHGGKSSQDLIDQIATSQQFEKQHQMALANAWTDLAYREGNEKYRDEFLGYATQALNDAMSTGESATETQKQPFSEQLQSYSDQMSVLQDQATAINDSITIGQGKGLKANVKQYRQLRDLSKAQQRNLDAQNKILREQLNTTEDITDEEKSQLEAQIRSNEASKRQLETDIQGYNDTMKNLLASEGKNLAQAISQALTENTTATGLTDETVTNLISGFSDIGDKADLSTLFYRTANGVRANVVEMQRLAEEQNDIVNAQFDKQINTQTAAIERYQNQIGKGKTDDTLRQMNIELRDILNEQAEYFASYQEQMNQFSALGQIALADQTANEGANYDKYKTAMKEAKEMYDKGLIGTDDFKTRAASIDQYGFDDYQTFKANYDKINKYMTDDTTGVVMFMEKLVEEGLAVKDADGNIVTAFEDIDQAAAKFEDGVNREWFLDMFGKVVEYGGKSNFVTSLEEAALKTEDLQTQLANAQKKKAEFMMEGYDSNVIEKQQDVIDDIQSDIEQISDASDDYIERSQEKFKKGFENVGKTLKELQKDYKQALKDGNTIGAEALKGTMESYAKKYGIDLDEDYGFDEAQYKKRMREVVGGTVENPLSLSQLGVDTEDSGLVGTTIYNIRKALTGSDTEMQGYIDAVKGLTTEQLKAIDLTDGKLVSPEDDGYVEGIQEAELAIDGMMRTLDLTSDQSDILFTSLKAIGAVADENPVLEGYMTSIASGKEKVEQFIGGRGLPFELEPDISNASYSDLQQRMHNLENLKLHFQDDPEATQYLESLQQETEITMVVRSKIEEGQLTPQDIMNMKDEQIITEFQLDSNAPDIEQQIADIRSQAQELGQGYDFTIRINNQQFADLLTVLGANPEIVAKYNLDTNEAESEASSFEDEHDGKELHQELVVEQEQQTVGPVAQPPQTQSQQHTVTQQMQYDMSGAAGSIDALRSAAGTPIIMPVDANTAPAEGEVEAVQTQASQEQHFNVTATGTSDVDVQDKNMNVGVNLDDSAIQNMDTTGKEITVTTNIEDNATDALNEIQSAVEELDGSDANPKVNVDNSSAMSSLQQVSNEVSRVGAMSVTPSVSVSVSGLSSLDDAIDKINRIQPKTVTITTVHRTYNQTVNSGGDNGQGVFGTAHQHSSYDTLSFAGGTAYSMWKNYRHSVGAYANGTTQNWSLKNNEDALVNELAPQHPESIVRNGRWQIIPGGPHVEHLKKGDIIFNAEQTDDLIRSGKTAQAGKIAFANGTATNGMPAHANKPVTGGASFNTNTGNPAISQASGQAAAAVSSAAGTVADTAKSTAKKVTASLKNFQEWLGKLYDWIEVRLDRQQRRIELAQAKSENAITSTNKNNIIDQAMKVYGDIANANKLTVETVAGGNGIKATKHSVNSKATGKFADTVRAAYRYQQQAWEVGEKAIKNNLFVSDKIQTADAQRKEMNRIIEWIMGGKIDIGTPNENVKAFIDEYRKWYELSLDQIKAVQDLKQEYKELEQTKLDNITDAFETLIGYNQAVKETAEATIDYYTSSGKNVNSNNIVKQYNNQITQQNKIISNLGREQTAYNKEVAKAKKIFGETSVEYQNAKQQQEDINKQLQEAKTELNELKKELKELDLTVIGYAIDKIKSFADRLGSIATLRETQGTVQVSDYTNQIKTNNDMIAKYYDDIVKREDMIRQKGWDVNSEYYKQYFDEIEKDKSQILSLMNSNENLKKTIETLRWKAFEDLHTKLQNAGKDFDHLRGLIKQSQLFDFEDDTIISDRGVANIALLADQLANAKQEIANYRDGLKRLNKEYTDHNLTLDEYNTKSREYIDIIQSQVNNIQSYKDALSDMYKTQITNENAALQEYIDKRKESLQIEKKYHDYQKSISKSNKNINQIRAQIAALTGVTNQAARSELAKLQDQLKSAQDDLDETRYQHAIDARTAGYDKLSKDSAEALDETLKKIDANAQVQEGIVTMMLDNISGKYKDAYNTINDIITSTGTKIEDVADKAIKAWKGVADGVKGAVNAVNAAKTSVQNTKANTSTYVKNGLSSGQINTSQANTGTTSGKVSGGQVAAQIKTSGTFTVSPTKPSYTYTGKAIKPSIVVKAGNTTVGASNYSVTYSNNINPGKGTISVTGKGIYGLWKGTGTFNIDGAKIAGQSPTTSATKSSPSLDKTSEATLKNLQLTTIKQIISKFAVPNPKPSTNEQKKKSALWQYIYNKSKRSANDANLVSLYKAIIDDTSKFKNGRLTDAQKNELLKKLKEVGYKKGTLGIKDDELNWTHEGEIIRRSDGAILRQLPAGTQVIPQFESANIMKWAQLNPNQMMAALSGIGGVTNNATSEKTVNYYDSLITINGPVDKYVYGDLKEFAEQLVKDRSFTQKMTDSVNKNNRKEASKIGFK